MPTITSSTTLTLTAGQAYVFLAGSGVGTAIADPGGRNAKYSIGPQQTAIGPFSTSVSVDVLITSGSIEYRVDTDGDLRDQDPAIAAQAAAIAAVEGRALQIDPSAGLQIAGAALTPAQAGVVRAGIGAEPVYDPAQNLPKLRAMIVSRIRESDEIVSSTPTITLGVANAASTIASAVAIAKDSALIGRSCRGEIGTGWPNSQYWYPRVKDTGAAAEAAAYKDGCPASNYIETNAATIEFGIKGVGVSATGRIWVTEYGVRKLLGVIPTVPSDGAKYLVKVETGVTLMRRWEVEQSNGFFAGFNVGPSDLYGAANLTGLHVLVVGDSFTEGAGTTGKYYKSWANEFCRMIGANKRTLSGIGATGYAANNSGAKKNLLERLQTDVIALTPDVIFHSMGLNDTQNGIDSNAGQVFDAIAAALPNTLQIVFGPFQPRSIDVDARRDAVQAACASRGLLFIDNVSMDEITGTGFQSAPTHDGNSDIVIGGDVGTDPTHPTEYGHKHIAKWRFDAFCRAIGM